MMMIGPQELKCVNNETNTTQDNQNRTTGTLPAVVELSAVVVKVGWDLARQWRNALGLVALDNLICLICPLVPHQVVRLVALQLCLHCTCVCVCVSQSGPLVSTTLPSPLGECQATALAARTPACCHGTAQAIRVVSKHIRVLVAVWSDGGACGGSEECCNMQHDQGRHHRET